MKIKKLLDRFKEPSSYAGLMGVALLVGQTSEEFEIYANVVAGVCAFAALVMKEFGSD